MKKRVILLILAALALLALTGCRTEPGPEDEICLITDPAGSESGESPAVSQPTETGGIPDDILSAETAVCRAKLVSADPLTAVDLGNGERSLGMFHLSAWGTLSGPDSKAVTADELRPGMILDIIWDGEIMDSYPCQIIADEVRVVEQSDDLVGMYRQALAELWAETGQKTGVERVAFDFSGLTGLSSGEQAALAYLVSCDLEMAESYIFSNNVGTWDELADSGVIVPDGEGWWPGGMLLSLSLYEQEEGHVGFIAASSRAREGALLVLTCIADRQEDGSWSYQSFSPSGT